MVRHTPAIIVNYQEKIHINLGNIGFFSSKIWLNTWRYTICLYSQLLDDFQMHGCELLHVCKSYMHDLNIYIRYSNNPPILRHIKMDTKG